MTKIKLTLEVTVEEATKILSILDGSTSIADIKSELVAKKEEKKEEPKKETKEEKKSITQTEIRSLAVELTKKGKAEEVKATIAEYADDGKLKSVAFEKYEELYRKLGELNG